MQSSSQEKIPHPQHMRRPHPRIFDRRRNRLTHVRTTDSLDRLDWLRTAKASDGLLVYKPLTHF